MKDNRIDRRDIDKIRRRLDLLLKDCFRYMKKEQLDYNLNLCVQCIEVHPPDKGLPPFCSEALRHEARLLSLLHGVGIYDTGVRPPTLPYEYGKLRGRVSIKPATKIIDTSLTKSKT